MPNKNRQRTVTHALIRRYADHLLEQEKARATVEKYVLYLTALAVHLRGRPFEKGDLIGWKERLTEKYAAASVNVILAAANGFFAFYGWNDCILKPLKIQRSLFCRAERELSHNEYVRLVKAAQAQGNQRLAFVIQTICATGIRVSELQFITVEAVGAGRAEVNNKGKRRTVFLPGKLCRALAGYARRQGRTAGPVFVTRGGKPLDRSNIWRDMKALCQSAGVAAEKVFPHNLRHLFARTYYTVEKDLSRLADILGHSNVNTTRVYTVESGVIHAKQMERMGLVIT